MTNLGSAPGGTTTTSDPARGRRALALTGVLLLMALGVARVVAALVSPDYYQGTRDVVTAALAVSTLPTLVLAVAASVRRGTGLLLAASGLTVVHLVAAVVLWAALDPADAQVPQRVVIELAGAAVGLGVAWWRVRDLRVGLLVAPAVVIVGVLLAATAPWSGSAWWAVLAQYGLRDALPEIGALVVALALGLVGRDQGDVVPLARTAPADAGRDRLATAAILLVAAACALDVVVPFAQGPGIRPWGAGPAFLTLQLVVAAVPAALVLAAGAAASGRRRLLVVAGATGAALVLASAAAAAAGASPATGQWVPLVGLAAALALAVAAGGRQARARSGLRWAAVVLLLAGAAPWDAWTDPMVRQYASSPLYWGQVLRPHVLVLAAVVAAVLLGLRNRWTRVAAAVVLAALVVDDLGTMLDQAAMLRRLTALNGLRVLAHLAAGVLALAAAVAVRHPAAPPRRAVTASEG